jgi:hypothetical protein
MGTLGREIGISSQDVSEHGAETPWSNLYK